MSLYDIKNTLNRNRPNMPPLTENVYKSISNLMLQFLDLCIDPNYKTGEIEQYYEILDLIISLSQSIKIGSDLLQDDISGHEIWKNIDLWFDIINYKIETEKVKQRVAEEKNLNERASKVKTIAISTIVTNMFNMSSFILKVEDKEKEKKLAEEKQKAENERAELVSKAEAIEKILNNEELFKEEIKKGWREEHHG